MEHPIQERGCVRNGLFVLVMAAWTLGFRALSVMAVLGEWRRPVPWWAGLIRGDKAEARR